MILDMIEETAGYYTYASNNTVMVKMGGKGKGWKCRVFYRMEDGEEDPDKGQLSFVRNFDATNKIVSKDNYQASLHAVWSILNEYEPKYGMIGASILYITQSPDMKGVVVFGNRNMFSDMKLKAYPGMLYKMHGNKYEFVGKVKLPTSKLFSDD